MRVLAIGLPTFDCVPSTLPSVPAFSCLLPSLDVVDLRSSVLRSEGNLKSASFCEVDAGLLRPAAERDLDLDRSFLSCGLHLLFGRFFRRDEVSSDSDETRFSTTGLTCRPRSLDRERDLLDVWTSILDGRSLSERGDALLILGEGR